jgi:hypothetical protein
VGLALGKEVHSNFVHDDLVKLCPLQNGGKAAESIARVCRSLLHGEREQDPMHDGEPSTASSW